MTMGKSPLLHGSSRRWSAPKFLFWTIVLATTYSAGLMMGGTAADLSSGKEEAKFDALHLASSTRHLYQKGPFYNHFEDSSIVVTISFGNATQTKLAERLVHSLRTSGQWNGRIAILTDNATHYQTTLAHELGSDLVIMQAKPEDLHPVDRNNQQIQFKTDAMRFKRFKMLALNYLDEHFPPPHYRLALYLDVEIVVARPLVTLFQDYQDQMIQHEIFADVNSDRPIQDGNHTLHARPCMSMFSDCATCARNNFNGGVLLLHRNRSRACLREWNEGILAGASWGIYDQRFLRDLRANNKCKVHQLPDYHRIYPKRREMRLKLSATIVHNTNTYNAKNIPEHIQQGYFDYLLNTSRFSRVELF